MFYLLLLPIGTILVIDEADKAPTYVTAVLKSLVEDGQMVLGDGRRIVSKESDVQEGDRYVLIHPVSFIVSRTTWRLCLYQPLNRTSE